MAINKIYPFAQAAVPPNILNDADYLTDSTTTTGYPAGSIAQSNYMSKAQRQTSAMSAGIAQWIADNQVTDVTDALSPATIAGMITAALSSVNFTTQPQFDNTQKAATTAFVKRAIGSFSKIESYGVNSALPITTVGNLVIPTSAGIALTLPLSSTVDYGSIIEFNGNGHGLAIARTGSDVINNGSAGALSSISLLEQDSVTLVAVFGGWSVIGGEGHQTVSSSFAQDMSTTGYKELPGGFILNWASGTSDVSGIMTINWAKPFQTALSCGWACERAPLGWTPTSTTIWGFSYSESTLVIGVSRVRGITGAGGPVVSTGISGTMFAIGY